MTDIPRMRTIKETAAATGLAEHYIRRLCTDGSIVAVKAGTKYLVNLDRLADFLNGETPAPTIPACGTIRRIG